MKVVPFPNSLCASTVPPRAWASCFGMASPNLLIRRKNYDTIPRMNISQITDDLFVGNMPFQRDYDRLRELGVRLIINMRFTLGPSLDAHPEPINALWLRSIDSPFFPISIPNLMLGAQAALETIQSGGKVYTHCAYGRHRGPAMGACVLIAQGYAPQDAMQLIKDRRSVADPFAWYIRPRILKFAKEWNHP